MEKDKMITYRESLLFCSSLSLNYALLSKPVDFSNWLLLCLGTMCLVALFIELRSEKLNGL